MRTQTRKLYQFSELSEEAKQKAIENYREQSANWFNDDLNDSIQSDEYWQETLKESGLTFTQIYWNTYPYEAGFGGLDFTNTQKLLDTLGVDKRLRVYKLLVDGSIYLEIVQKGTAMEDVQNIGWDSWDRDTEASLTRKDIENLGVICDNVLAHINNLEHDLVESIRSDEEYLQSDEYIAETLDINDYEFLETGERI